jgi:iron complex outermembrane recepter protein
MRERHLTRAIRTESPTRPMPRRLIILAASLVLAGQAPDVVGAAEVPAPAAPAASSSGLETILVTAQKRAENLQDVGLAMAVFSGDTLLDAGVMDAMQLQTVVPSLTYVATGFMAQPYLRGIGTRQSTVGLEPSVATYIDDRYVARPFAAMFDMLDVERVEVLKGPQAVLYGRNAAGGAIRAITKDPSDSSVEIVGRAGDYDERTLGIRAGGPLGERLSGQISAALNQRDGFAGNLVASGRDTADDLDRQAYRGKLLWDVTEKVHAKLGVSWWRSTDWTGRDLAASRATNGTASRRRSPGTTT